MPLAQRPLLAALIVLASVAVARPAAAQSTGVAGTTGTTTTASLADGDIFIGVQQTEGANLAAFDLARFFNKANCDCKTPVFLYFTLTNTGFAKRLAVPSGNLSFWIGSQCADPILQKTNCQLLKSEQIGTFMNLGRDTIQTSADAISANTTIATTSLDGGTGTITGGTTPNTTCTSPTNGFNQTVWAIFDYGADGTFDFSATQAIFVDLTPPPAPTNIKVAPGNEALTVTWTAVDYTLNMDLQGYQVFCQRGDAQVFGDGTFPSVVKTCSNTAGAGVMGLDPLFACSPLLNRTVDSYRIKILQNGITYGAAVVAVDNSGNALAPDLGGCTDPKMPNNDPTCLFKQPERTLSFFDTYRDGNQTNGAAGQTATPGKATGGFCAVATGDAGRGRWAVGGAAGLLVAAAVARARRRRR
jgi:MYXO-CTERM domain-containing protein